MFTAIVAATALIIGTFLERIIFAIFVLIFARQALRMYRKARSKIITFTAPVVAMVKEKATRFARRVGFAFGPTIRVAV